MDIIKSIILGIVEGITEFLPVSSTGHLIIANEFISFSPELNKIFDIFIQLGAILSVVIIYRKKLFPVKDVAKREYNHLLKMLIISSLPILVIGFLLHSYIITYLFSSLTVAIALIFWGIGIILIDKRQHRVKIDSLYKIDGKSALFIGLVQCLALIPGTSRSAVTIIGALLLGVTSTIAVEYSFFLAIPALSAASLFSLISTEFQYSHHEIIILTVGFLTSFITACLAIRFFIRYIRKHGFHVFGYYRIILGLVVLAYFSIKNIL